MNSVKKYLNADKRRVLMNYLRPSQYYMHPELKTKDIPNKRWKMLLTMRDLRLWIEENAPNSSRTAKYKAEIYQINEELSYLQFRGKKKKIKNLIKNKIFMFCLAMALPLLLFIAISIGFTYWAPRHYRGHISQYNRPVHQGTTGGFTVLHDGTIPKLTTMDMTEILGI